MVPDVEPLPPPMPSMPSERCSPTVLVERSRWSPVCSEVSRERFSPLSPPVTVLVSSVLLDASGVDALVWVPSDLERLTSPFSRSPLMVVWWLIESACPSAVRVTVLPVVVLAFSKP
jgi:hypothetical protein